MVDEYSSDQLWKLYEFLPKELQDVIFSEETANTIFEIGKRNNLEDEKISEIAKYVGYTLLGVLLPKEFEDCIKEKLSLSPEKAKQISHEINRFVFFPVKSFLELIYEQKQEDLDIIAKEENLAKEKIPESYQKSKDIYREPIE